MASINVNAKCKFLPHSGHRWDCCDAHHLHSHSWFQLNLGTSFTRVFFVVWFPGRNSHKNTLCRKHEGPKIFNVTFWTSEELEAEKKIQRQWWWFSRCSEGLLQLLRCKTREHARFWFRDCGARLINQRLFLAKRFEKNVSAGYAHMFVVVVISCWYLFCGINESQIVSQTPREIFCAFGFQFLDFSGSCSVAYTSISIILCQIVSHCSDIYYF